jgi:hypothetical protein
MKDDSGARRSSSAHAAVWYFASTSVVDLPNMDEYLYLNLALVDPGLCIYTGSLSAQAPVQTNEVGGYGWDAD